MVEEDLSFQDSLGHRVSCLITAPEQRTDRAAVLCHGFLSSKHSTTNKTLTRLLLDRHVATLRFDFFGHGESDGPFEELTTMIAVGQALAALEVAASRGYRRLALVGSSFGGLVATLATARWMERATPSSQTSRPSSTSLRCLALKCPVVDFSEELSLEFGPQEMARWKGTDTIPNITGGPGRVKLAYGFYEDCRNHVAYGPAKTISIPTLIVQGDRDEFIPLHQSQRLFENLAGQKCLEVLPGADHQFSKAEDFHKMTSLIVDWVSTHI